MFFLSCILYYTVLFIYLIICLFDGGKNGGSCPTCTASIDYESSASTVKASRTFYLPIIYLIIEMALEISYL